PEDFKKKYQFKSLHYVPAPEISLEKHNLPASVETLMGKSARFAVVGAKLALEDAGFEITAGGRYFTVKGLENPDIVIGTGMGSLQTAFDSYTAHVFEGDMEVPGKYGIEVRFNRMVIPILMPNSASAWVSILFGIKGANFTINASCASGTCAIGEAYLRIKNGISSIVVTGGVECLAEKHGGVMRGFDILSTLTRSENGNPMPFSKNRSGFLFNEGAGCILILEELESALKRGAEIYAEICGYECTSDAYNIVQMEENGEQVEKILAKLAGNTKIEYYNAHGTGTILNDDIEAKAIRKLFGDTNSQPLINSTKGLLGHSVGASGAIEAAVTALSIKESVVHGSLVTEPVDNLNIAMETTSVEINHAISASYGFGGHNAAILFKRYEKDNG
ncbi:MAG: beta-ketoacyl-[acyl-carrier-protein] synthase family protein, partial [Clostridiaceae bacterium]|nr:beta-ketoacyl-[acyl-carrier-protein] synthase family protein [Clostridiaceae bacterium]